MSFDPITPTPDHYRMALCIADQQNTGENIIALAKYLKKRHKQPRFVPARFRHDDQELTLNLHAVDDGTLIKTIERLRSKNRTEILLQLYQETSGPAPRQKHEHQSATA